MDPIAKYNKLVTDANFNRDPAEILLDLIHVYLDYQIPLNRIKFYEAGLLDQRPDILTDEDAFVRADIDPAYDYRFPGDNGFLYRRLPASALAARALSGIEPVTGSFPFRSMDLLLQLNRYYQVQLSPDDVLDEEYDFGATVFTLRFAPTSWCYQGEIVVPVTWGGYTDGLRITANGAPRQVQTLALRIADENAS